MSPPSPPSLAPHPWVASLLLTGVAGFLLLSAALFAPSWERAFRSDASPAAWLSSALLLALAATTLRLTAERALPWRLGAWLVVSFGVLALDEQFMLHELWKFRCIEWTAACQSGWVREAPLLAVVVVGVATLAWLHRALSHRSTQALMWAGLCVGRGALAGAPGSGMPPWLEPFADVFEVLAEALVLAALLRQPAPPP